MAAKTENKTPELSAAQAAELDKQVAAGVESPDVSSIVNDDETAKVAEAFFAGELTPGYAIKFVTRGGESVPVVRKLG